MLPKSKELSALGIILELTSAVNTTLSVLASPRVTEPFVPALKLSSVNFYLFDVFPNIDDLPILISMTFALLSISTIVSQYLFTDAFPLSNNKLLLCGVLLLLFSYLTMALFPKISIYYLSIIINGIGGGMLRPAISSSLSLSQTPEHQGIAAGYLGSVYPVGHILTPVLAMPIYAINPSYLYYFSSMLCLICFIFIISHPVFRKEIRI
mgnify:CR=1 FL=1